MMYYWNPKRLKELKAAGYKLHAAPEAKATSHKHQASSTVDPDPTDPKPEPSSGSEAPSSKLQASSNKQQA